MDRGCEEDTSISSVDRSAPRKSHSQKISEELRRKASAINRPTRTLSSTSYNLEVNGLRNNGARAHADKAQKLRNADSVEHLRVFVPRFALDRIASERMQCSKMAGVAMFADVSGFSTFADKLENQNALKLEKVRRESTLHNGANYVEPPSPMLKVKRASAYRARSSTGEPSSPMLIQSRNFFEPNSPTIAETNSAEWDIPAAQNGGGSGNSNIWKRFRAAQVGSNVVGRKNSSEGMASSIGGSPPRGSRRISIRRGSKILNKAGSFLRRRRASTTSSDDETENTKSPGRLRLNMSSLKLSRGKSETGSHYQYSASNHARELGHNDAAGQLSQVLSAVLANMVDIALHHGGDVVSFCGDALLVVFPFSSESSLVDQAATINSSATSSIMTPGIQTSFNAAHGGLKCLEAARAVMCALELLNVPQNTGYESELGIHIGMGVSNSISTVHVGGVGGVWQSFVAGEVLDQMYGAEHISQRGELVVSRELHQLLAECEARYGCSTDGEMVESRTENRGGEFFVVHQLVLSDVAKSTIPPIVRHQVELNDAALEVLRGCVPPPYLALGVATAETRRITCIFAELNEAPRMKNIGEDGTDFISRRRSVLVKRAGEENSMGIDAADEDMRRTTAEEHNAAALQTYQAFAASVESSLVRFEGTLRQIVFDDKGLVAIGVVGLPPHGHEDHAARGVCIGVDIVDRLRATADPMQNIESNSKTRDGKPRLKKRLGGSVGISTGAAYCGVVGGDGRCDYVVIGDVVNLAARLMGSCSKLNAAVAAMSASGDAQLNVSDTGVNVATVTEESRLERESSGSATTRTAIMPAGVRVLCDLSTSKTSRSSLGKTIKFDMLGEIKVKGKEQPVAIFHARKRSNTRSRRSSLHLKLSNHASTAKGDDGDDDNSDGKGSSVAESSMLIVPLVGRDFEQQCFRRTFLKMLSPNSAPRATVFTLLGSRGSGKSRLLDELYGLAATHASSMTEGVNRPRVSLYLSGAEPTTSDVPYHAWSAIVLEMLDITAELLLPAAETKDDPRSIKQRKKNWAWNPGDMGICEAICDENRGSASARSYPEQRYMPGERSPTVGIRTGMIRRASSAGLVTFENIENAHHQQPRSAFRRTCILRQKVRTSKPHFFRKRSASLTEGGVDDLVFRTPPIASAGAGEGKSTNPRNHGINSVAPATNMTDHGDVAANGTVCDARDESAAFLDAFGDGSGNRSRRKSNPKNGDEVHGWAGGGSVAKLLKHPLAAGLMKIGACSEKDLKLLAPIIQLEGSADNDEHIPQTLHLHQNYPRNLHSHPAQISTESPAHRLNQTVTALMRPDAIDLVHRGGNTSNTPYTNGGSNNSQDSSQEKKTVIFMDDVQWLDKGSFDLLVHMASHANHTLLCLTSRPPPPARRRNLLEPSSNAAQKLSSDGVRNIEMGNLGKDWRRATRHVLWDEHAVNNNHATDHVLHHPSLSHSLDHHGKSYTKDAFSADRDARLRWLLDEVTDTVVELTPLSHVSVSLMLNHLHQAVIDSQVIRLVESKTHGNPMDAIHLVEEMLDIGMLKVEDGAVSFEDTYADPGARDRLELLPEDTQAVIFARYSRLSLKEQQVLWIMSVIGMVCPFPTLVSLLAELLGLDAMEYKTRQFVQVMLTDLVSKGLVNDITSWAEQDGTSDDVKVIVTEEDIDSSLLSPNGKSKSAQNSARDTTRFLPANSASVEGGMTREESLRTYSFSNADVMDVIYNTILPHDRRVLHAMCFDVLRRSEAARNGMMFDTLAHHAQRAGLYLEAVHCFEQSALEAQAYGDVGRMIENLRACISIAEDMEARSTEINFPPHDMQRVTATKGPNPDEDLAGGVAGKAVVEKDVRFTYTMKGYWLLQLSALVFSNEYDEGEEVVHESTMETTRRTLTRALEAFSSAIYFIEEQHADAFRIATLGAKDEATSDGKRSFQGQSHIISPSEMRSLRLRVSMFYHFGWSWLLGERVPSVDVNMFTIRKGKGNRAMRNGIDPNDTSGIGGSSIESNGVDSKQFGKARADARREYFEALVGLREVQRLMRAVTQECERFDRLNSQVRRKRHAIHRRTVKRSLMLHIPETCTLGAPHFTGCNVGCECAKCRNNHGSMAPRSEKSRPSVSVEKKLFAQQISKTLNQASQANAHHKKGRLFHVVRLKSLGLGTIGRISSRGSTRSTQLDNDHDHF